MASQRLSNWDKQTVSNVCAEYLDRQHKMVPFPVSEAEFRDWVVQSCDQSVFVPWEFLREQDHRLVATNWRSSMKVRIDANHAAHLSLGTCDPGIPDLKYVFTDNMDKHDEVVEWLASQRVSREEADSAKSYFRGAFAHCSTAGQIKRILPDLVGLLPDQMKKSLFNMVRMSRYPMGWANNVDVDVETKAMDLLSMGAILQVPDDVWQPDCGFRRITT